MLGNKSFLLLGNLRSLCAIFDRPISSPYHLKDHIYCLSWSRYFCLISLTINHLFNPYVIALYLCSSWILLVYVIERLKGNMAGVNESIDRWKSVEKGKSNFFPWLSRFPWTEFRGSPLRQCTVCCNLDQLRRFVRLQSGADRRRDNNLMELAARSNTTICDPLVWDSVRFPILFRSLKRWHLWRVKWEMDRRVTLWVCWWTWEGALRGVERASATFVLPTLWCYQCNYLSK